jgi:hypothetical protein
LTEPYLSMRKKATDGATTEGSTELKIEALRARLDKMEALIQDQSKELKTEVISSHQFMKLELKDQLDEFFARLMRVQTSTPSPQPLAIEFMASNVAQVEQSPTLGDHSVTIPMFKLSVSQQAHLALPKNHCIHSVHTSSSTKATPSSTNTTNQPTNQPNKHISTSTVTSLP